MLYHVTAGLKKIDIPDVELQLRVGFTLSMEIELEPLLRTMIPKFLDLRLMTSRRRSLPPNKV